MRRWSSPTGRRTVSSVSGRTKSRMRCGSTATASRSHCPTARSTCAADVSRRTAVSWRTTRTSRDAFRSTRDRSVWRSSAASSAGKGSPVSTGPAIGGIFWRGDDKELFFLSSPEQAVTAVDVKTSPAFEAGTPRLLFKPPNGTFAPRAAQQRRHPRWPALRGPRSAAAGADAREHGSTAMIREMRAFLHSSSSCRR